MTPPLTSESLAIDRTVLAHERTLMAWSRTSVSMTSFGFTIFSFFREMPDRHARDAVLGPRRIAILLAGTGTVILVLAMLQYRAAVRTLTAEQAQKRKSLAMFSSGIIALIGFTVVYAVAVQH